jgi:amino acid permease
VGSDDKTERPKSKPETIRTIYFFLERRENTKNTTVGTTKTFGPTWTTLTSPTCGSRLDSYGFDPAILDTTRRTDDDDRLREREKEGRSIAIVFRLSSGSLTTLAGGLLYPNYIMIVVGSIFKKKKTSIAVFISWSWWWWCGVENHHHHACCTCSADAFLLHRRHTTTLPRPAPRSSRRAAVRPRLVVGRRGGGGTETAAFPLKSSSSPMSNSNSNGTNKNNPTSSSTSTTASVTSFALVAGVTFNVVKAMLGTGMLALPMGVATISNYQSALLPASLLMVTLALLSAYTFALYGRLAHALQQQQPPPLTLGEIWRTLGKQNGEKRDTSAIISFTNFMFCFGCCLSISQILGDTFSSLARGLMMMSGTSTTGRTAGSFFFLRPAAWLVSRPAAILVVTTAFLLPLCRLKSLAALAPFSIVVVMGALTTVGFLGYRCPAVFPQSPYAAGGVWAVAASAPGATAPFGTYSRIVSLAPLSLVSMSCIALMAHFSAIDFYQALVPAPAVPPNNKNLPPSEPGTGGAEASSSSSSSSSLVLRNYMAMATVSFAVTAVISILAMTFGFLTFGAASTGNILNNYHVNDGGAIVSRLLCGISLIGSFPMVMRPCQSSALGLFRLPPTDRNNVRMTTTLLAVVTTLALTVQNVGFVISLNGAIMGTSLVYTIPCLLFLKLTSQNKPARITTSRTTGTTGVTASTTTRLKVERAFCRLLIAFGVTAMVAGAASAVITSFYPKWLS